MRSSRRTDTPDGWVPADVFSTEFPHLHEQIRQLHMEHRLDVAFMERLFATSRVAVFRAVDTSDYIATLLELYPTLPPHQQRELRAIADDLIAMARQVPHEAVARAASLRSAELKSSRHDERGVLHQAFAGDWAGVQRDMARIKAWLAK